MIMMPYSWRWSSLQLTGQADFWHPTGNNYRLGALSNLYPYLARRLGVEPLAELTMLPLPGEFSDLLKSWANREVDFATG
jgi:hypothetical protein